MDGYFVLKCKEFELLDILTAEEAGMVFKLAMRRVKEDDWDTEDLNALSPKAAYVYGVIASCMYQDYYDLTSGVS